MEFQVVLGFELVEVVEELQGELSNHLPRFENSLDILKVSEV